MLVNGPEQNGNGALDVSGSFVISDRVLTAAAASAWRSRRPPNRRRAGFATLDSALPAGTTVQIVDKVVASFVTSKPCSPGGTSPTRQVQNIVYSSSKITPGSEYRIHTGGWRR